MLKLTLLSALLCGATVLVAQPKESTPAPPSKWVINIGGGYQWASKPPALGRYTDELVSWPSTGLSYSFELSYFWQPKLGLFAAAQFSQTPKDWRRTLQQAVEREFPGKIVRLTALRGVWDPAISQAMFGLRGRFDFHRLHFQPSLGIGFTEGQISDGAADLKTPGSNALSNVFAYASEADPWYDAFTLNLGARLEMPLWRQFKGTVSINYYWVKPNETFEFHQLDQIAGTQFEELLEYRQAQNVLALTAGLSYHFKRRNRGK